LTLNGHRPDYSLCLFVKPTLPALASRRQWADKELRRRQSQMRNIAFASRAAGILFLGEIHITSGYGRGLSLDMGGHHASYRANPGRPLLLLPELRSALCGDVFAAFERQQQHRKVCGLRTGHGRVEFNQRSHLQARSPT